jgi:hypothetical protein
MPNLADHGILEQIRQSHHIHILTGSGDHEDPEARDDLPELYMVKA